MHDVINLIKMYTREAEKQQEFLKMTRERARNGFDRYLAHADEQIKDMARMQEQLAAQQQALFERVFGPALVTEFENLLNVWGWYALNAFLFALWQATDDIAFQLWEAGGRQSDVQLDNWLEAERKVLAALRAPMGAK